MTNSFIRKSWNETLASLRSILDIHRFVYPRYTLLLPHEITRYLGCPVISSEAVFGAFAIGVTVVTIIWWRRRMQRLHGPKIDMVELAGNQENINVDRLIEMQGRECKMPAEADSRAVKIIPGPPVEME